MKFYLNENRKYHSYCKFVYAVHLFQGKPLINSIQIHDKDLYQNFNCIQEILKTKDIEIGRTALLAHLAKGHVSYCRHLASVVINFSKLFFSETARLIGTKFGMNVPWGILHRIVVGIFDLSKNMAAVTKNRT